VEQQIGQLFMIGLSGAELTSAEADFIVANNIGGVCLFARNLVSPKQIHKLTSDLRELQGRLPDRAPLLVAVDMEGGRVHRLKPPFTQWPAVAKLTPLDSTSLAFKFANMMGLELIAAGINLDFAPVIDVLTNSENKVIGDRSLSADVAVVEKLGSAMVRGYLKSGIVACAKHFPGHGGTWADSHEELPVDDMTLEDLRGRVFPAFKKAFRARVDMTMTAHVVFPKVDAHAPATFSRKFLKDILRDDFRFPGIVISDDLDMKAVALHHAKEDIPVLALQAGCNMLLYCNEPDSPPRALEGVRRGLADKKIEASHVQASLKMIQELKREKLAPLKYPDFTEAAKIIGHPSHLRLAMAVSEGQIPEELLNT
jgi:beta-N-acetylhexosaminidase